MGARGMPGQWHGVPASGVERGRVAAAGRLAGDIGAPGGTQGWGEAEEGELGWGWGVLGGRVPAEDGVDDGAG